MRRSLLLLLTVAAVLLSAQLVSQHAAGRKGQERDQIVDQVPVVAEYISPGDRHKLELTDRRALMEIQGRGGRVVGDYDSFIIVEVNSAAAKEITASGRAQFRDEYNLILLNAGAIDTTMREAQSPRTPSVTPGDSSGKRMHLLQFAGPIKPEWYESVVETGVEVVTYIPNNAYLVYGDSRSIGRMRRLVRNSAVMQWEGEYRDEYKVDRSIYEQKEKGNVKAQGLTSSARLYAIQLIKDAKANDATLALIQNSTKEPIKNQYEILKYVNIIVSLPPQAIKQISAQKDVVSIQPYVMPKIRDERQDQIIAGNITGNAPNAADYLAYLAGKGFTQAQFTASGFAVDVSDDGLENGLTTVDNPFLHIGGLQANASRVVYNRIENSGGPVTPGRTGFQGHGNLNTHVIAGFIPFAFASGFPHADSAGFRYGLGVSPFVKVGMSTIFTPNFTSPNFPNLQARAYQDGARISSNSWGGSVDGAYDVDSQAYDALARDAQPAGSAFPTVGNQEMVLVFAAGNDGTLGAQTVNAPGTAKNVICVGAAENVHSHSIPNGGDSATGLDGCNISDTQADSANDIVNFSSRGPCADGRKKPDIVGPGTHVTGGVAQQPAPGANGTALATFNASSVCALSLSDGSTGNPSNFFPLSQQWTTTSSGTSHSTPAVAGAAALIRQYFINQGLTPPSPAMTKAALMNSARYMTGTSANDTLWSNNQGMGETNLNSFFDIFAINHILRDQDAMDMFTATGQQRVITGNVADNTKPFRVTLAWTDPPGPTSGNAFINNLDLEVTIGGSSYKGNVFSGANSATGGSADTRNNVESVFVPAGASGPFAVRVKATNIAGDGVPGNASALDQDYALVINNGTPGSQPVLVSTGATIVSENCAPANGVVDPNETVTVNLCLQNIGTQDTANLTGTLQASGGVINIQPPNPQNYGVVMVNSTVCRNFTFTVGNVACGSMVTATLQLQDGASNLGTVTYNLQTGTLNTVLSQNWDGVVAPALPAGWTTSFSNGAADCSPSGSCTLGNNWTTSTTNSPPSAPNVAFHNDPTCVTDNFLVSPSISITKTSAQLTFRNAFNLENTFDGSVLEVSSPNINGGTFTDITNAAAGGSFVSGGYTGTISANFFSPIVGRQAWTGLSGGTGAAPSYLTTVVNLGPNVAGHIISLRWRLASDCSLSASGTSGQWIDNVVVTDGFLCCVLCTSITCPANITKSNDPNQCGAVVTYPAPTPVGSGCGTITCSPASASFFTKGTTTVSCTSAGPTCQFTVTVNDTQPPTITCAPNTTATTPNTTDPCAVVNFTAAASDNCPMVTVVCNPPSGSCFAVGCTTVTCTATDMSGNTATCTFQVCVFNVCLQDDSNPNNRILVNTITGDYRFCCNGITFTGKGKMTIQGNTSTLEHNTLDRRVRASVTGSSHLGNASLQSPPGRLRCNIADSDTQNNTTCSTCK